MVGVDQDLGVPMNDQLFKISLLSLTLSLMSVQSFACLDEGKVLSLNSDNKTHTVALDSGNEYTFYGKRHPLLPIIQNSLEHNKEICITNKLENTPLQIVASFKDFKTPTIFSQNCVKQGFVRKVYVNARYDWFFLEDNFSIRVTHSSKLTPKLYEASFKKKEVCLTKMNLDATDGTWGIPREMIISND